jgi:CRISPR/Cas system CMR subunit Cmr4 (Cas7 group RAMP superfamily)
MQSKQQIYAANVAKARIIYNKNKEVYTIKIAFNVTETTANGKLKFPVKCDFVSGNFCYETFESDKQRIIEQAKKQLRTDVIEFV